MSRAVGRESLDLPKFGRENLDMGRESLDVPKLGRESLDMGHESLCPENRAFSALVWKIAMTPL